MYFLELKNYISLSFFYHKPIKDSKDERALTSKKSKCDKKEEKLGFFHKFGFGSKSASVSPVKNIISSIPRRSSEIHDETKSRKIQRKNDVEAIEKSSTTKKGISEKAKEKSPKLKVKNNDKKVVKEEAAVEVVEIDVDNAAMDVKVDEDDKKVHSPISSYEEEEEQSIAVAAAEIVAIPETGTESDARVSQTIIMKKRTLHEAKTETLILPFGNICSSKDS
uniref:Uncharacterized protein n=1 Tax=Panagrolaimus sp. PS1159 TaxID=55785 RepID=A0AC35FUI0_9BILA